MIHRHRLVVTIVTLGLALSAFGDRSSAQSQPTYRVTDIGAIAGTGDGQFADLIAVTPAALNLSGEVVANASSGVPDGCCDEFTPVQGPWSVAFHSVGGTVRRIGRERDYSLATDVNASGAIVGFATKHDRHMTDGDAVLWRDGDLQILPSLEGGFAIAYGINDSGDVVGTSRIAPGDDTQHATLWRDYEATDLGTLGGPNSVAYDINNSGQVAGKAVQTGALYLPTVWQNGSVVRLPLPTYWVKGAALSLNDDGVVVGSGAMEFNESPLRWTDGNLEQLPGFADRVTGVAEDINSSGDIVGKIYRQDSATGGYVGVIWTDGGVFDLNDLIPADSGYLVIDAVSLNDAGQVLATATKDGVQHGVLLTPASGAGRQTVAVATVRGAIEGWRESA